MVFSFSSKMKGMWKRPADVLSGKPEKLRRHTNHFWKKSQNMRSGKDLPMNITTAAIGPEMREIEKETGRKPPREAKSSDGDVDPLGILANSDPGKMVTEL